MLLAFNTDRDYARILSRVFHHRGPIVVIVLSVELVVGFQDHLGAALQQIRTWEPVCKFALQIIQVLSS